MTIIWATIVVLGVLIFVHELGHCLAARSVGVRVDRFSIGFPPRLITFTSVPGGWEFRLYFYSRKESPKLVWAPVVQRFISRPGRKGSNTEYCLAAFPLGGYVKMAGVIDESLDPTIHHEPYELLSKPAWIQGWVMSAGVFMNVLLAFFLLSGVALKTVQVQVSSEPVVATVSEDMPAEAAGLQSGDRVVAIDGQPVSTWDDLSDYIHQRPNRELVLTLQRDGEEFQQPLVSSYRYNPLSRDTLGLIGIAPAVKPIGPFLALQVGARSTANAFGVIFITLRMLFTGQASFKDLGGPIMIAQISGEAARAGWLPFFTFMAFISCNLAFINILPIPGLDGGHILVTLIETLIRRPLKIKTRLAIQQVGMAFLLLLMFAVIYNDVSRLLGR